MHLIALLRRMLPGLTVLALAGFAGFLWGRA